MLWSHLPAIAISRVHLKMGCGGGREGYCRGLENSQWTDGYRIAYLQYTSILHSSLFRPTCQSAWGQRSVVVDFVAGWATLKPCGVHVIVSMTSDCCGRILHKVLWQNPLGGRRAMGSFIRACLGISPIPKAPELHAQRQPASGGLQC